MEECGSLGCGGPPAPLRLRPMGPFCGERSRWWDQEGRSSPERKAWKPVTPETLRCPEVLRRTPRDDRAGPSSKPPHRAREPERLLGDTPATSADPPSSGDAAGANKPYG